MKYNIKGTDYELRYSIRAMMMYENITGESFNPDNLTNILTFFYCIVVSSSKDYSYSFDEFIDNLDENPNILQELTQWMISVNSTNNLVKKN